MPAPTVYSEMFLDRLDSFLEELMLDHDITAGVAATGPAAAYAEVWEWGNIRQSKPGPRTVLGTNPNGKMVWLSVQAPFGYIRIHENDFWQALKEELKKVKFNSTNSEGITDELNAAARKAMKVCAQLIADSAPVDTGDLRDSIKPVTGEDPLFDEEEDVSPFLGDIDSIESLI